MKTIFLPLSIIFFVFNFYISTIAQKTGSPLDELPPYIKQITHFGQRADWSHDGNRILFLEKTYGDVYEIDLQSQIIKPITHHFYHEGFTRALFLANGDILLSGAESFDAREPHKSRHEDNAQLWVLNKKLDSPPVKLGEHCSEGPAVSRTRMHIAWTQKGSMYTGDIEYENDKATITNKKEVFNKDKVDFQCNPETQNFRPPLEKELIFSAYNYQGGEVMGINLETGEITNYSMADNEYDEPEGIFPDGNSTLTETDHHKSQRKEFFGHQHIDIHRLWLDGSGKFERITYFNDYEGYKASNPVVSDDGKYIAFQMAKYGDPAGVGRGLFILDLAGFELSKKKK